MWYFAALVVVLINRGRGLCLSCVESCDLVLSRLPLHVVAPSTRTPDAERVKHFLRLLSLTAVLLVPMTTSLLPIWKWSVKKEEACLHTHFLCLSRMGGALGD